MSKYSSCLIHRNFLVGISYSDATPGQSFAYNPYGELETDNLRVGNHTHLITEKKDAFGRSTGYIYARSGAAQHTVSIGYGEDGRIATAGFLQGSAPQTFTWQYMEGSGLPSVMAMPNGMTLEWGYEEKRNLVSTMVYKRGATRVVEREYVYDSLARPVTRRTARQGNTVNDSFACNSRSELTAATVSGKTYGYSYDNIGNRKTAREDAEEATAYTTGPLNQYTAIERGEEAAFEPVHDADGNQTLIRTSTGIWQVAYNAENRPVRFVNESAKTVVECTYDYMGRRHTRKVSVNGTVSSYLRYMYRGYLQIAAIDAVSGVFRWFLFWDPTQPEAARPLAIRKDGAWYAYGWDLTGNVTGIFGKAGYLRTVYTYTPYGEVTAEGDVTQPIQWSSEYSDEELGLVYYNYRHLNPHDGRWISRDPIEEEGGWNLFAFVGNKIFNQSDILGLICTIEYSIKLHTILIRKVDKDSNILRLTTSRVFSGNGDGKNNPDNVGNKDNGPIPPGKYYVIKRQSGGIRSQIKDWTYKLWNDNDKNQ
ncbi:DUF2778 domain-containing protein [Akkermansia muciniphila]|uniref:RHS repeat-associated core domain-containing protein n=2 Tax=Akkermansia muciniphila TaxID=239935 RepID=B2UR86_AKKM8|nr:RHS repeat-associated core domain-containing protein [Akkermansia muciniphila]ACD04971.1 hypothetical protein Amuc_1145 [Akkermansia muciniphila ATCC BAA-835]MCO6191739.1 hypothetical protein [Akkermansia muciniphila]MCO6193664.1 hypothetical protein [Akkermansia muciniphila]MCO6195593.1 hypothetical protein [Akkermansia muciniphila]MCO6197521.1 hypothetical protein [Akkermansia muciniphila]